MEITRTRILIIFDILLIISGISGLIQSLWGKAYMLVYYTEISNLLSLVIAVITLAYRLISKEKKLTRGLILCKYTTTVMLSVTFIIVTVVLFPLYVKAGSWGTGFEKLYLGASFFNHFFTPAISFAGFMIENINVSLKPLDAAIATISTVVYGIILLILNGLKLVTGPYPFLMIYNQTVMQTICWFIGIAGGTLLIALAIGNGNSYFNE
ncbi:MAG: hypothetical protein HUJ71_03830 [Pseudobutyrivibrio sp.]|nr:hypothetical protein [Pseudobutyrivibrio sp.]